MNAHTLITPVISPHPSSPHGGWLKTFPLCTFLELGAYPTAPGSARGHARNVLEDWRLCELAEAVLLVLSELVTNSVIATSEVRWEAALPPVRLWMLAGAGASGTGEVMILVWDAVSELPESREVDALDESGRGLWIVERCSARLDFYLPPAPYEGKVARALIDRPWSDQRPG